MGGGIQIGSVDKFPKPQIYGSFKGKGKGQKGKGTFKPKHSQHLNTFQQQPPGLKPTYLYADNEYNQYHTKSHEEMCTEFNICH